jgi:NADPH:quinone reductase-like Zn-dependent oxidoreductase
MPGWRAFHPDDVAILRQLIADGAIHARIDRRYPLAEIVAALREVHEGRNKGKVVITV